MFIIISIIIIILLFTIIISMNEKKQHLDESIFEISEDIYEKLEQENKERKVRNYVEEMTLFELQQMLPDDIFTRLPKKRKDMEEEVIRLIHNGKIAFKNNNSLYYVDSDKIAENDRNYYTENFKEKKSDLKQFKSIRKKNGIFVNMEFFSNYENTEKQNLESLESDNITTNEVSLEEKIKYALTLEPTKKNLTTFNALLNEYNHLDFDSKLKINRSYTSQLEALKNKAERA